MFVMILLLLNKFPHGDNEVALYCIILYCVILYCIVLYCIVICIIKKKRKFVL